MSEENEEQQKMSAAVQDIAYDAARLESSLGNLRNSTDLGHVIEQLKTLLYSVPLKAAEAGMVTGNINSAINQGEQARRNAEVQEIAETTAAVATVTGAAQDWGSFQNALFNHMTQEEKDFFKSLEGPQQIAMVDENGKVIAQNQSIDGEVLQKDFLRIEYHTLSKKEQDEIGLPPGDKTPEESLAQLETSLQRMEGLQAQKLLDSGLDKEEVEEKIRENHGRFRNAHEQIGLVRRSHEKLEEFHGRDNVDERMEKSAELELKTRSDRLGQILREDIVDGTLVPHNHEQERAQAREFSQGVDMVDPSKPLHTPAGSRPQSGEIIR